MCNRLRFSILLRGCAFIAKKVVSFRQAGKNGSPLRRLHRLRRVFERKRQNIREGLALHGARVFHGSSRCGGAVFHGDIRKALADQRTFPQPFHQLTVRSDTGSPENLHKPSLFVSRACEDTKRLICMPVDRACKRNTAGLRGSS